MGGEQIREIREAFEGRRRRGQENDLTTTWGNAKTGEAVWDATYRLQLYSKGDT